jgi:hypothetical protein
MSVISKLFLAGAACFGLANAERAVAQLTAFGPISPDNGFPTWYRDGAGTQLDLCLSNPALCALLAQREQRGHGDLLKHGPRRQRRRTGLLTGDLLR